jgi:hypothetical protein
MSDIFYYTGIGSRKTPKEILIKMEEVARRLALQGKILRSGGADGADSAFEEGCKKAEGKMEIYLPYKNFRVKDGRICTQFDLIINKEKSKEIFEELASEYKDFNKNSPDYIYQLMQRNMHQVLGENLDSPSSFVICYTPNGEDIGGTRWALRLARKYNIPIYNLGNK